MSSSYPYDYGPNDHFDGTHFFSVEPIKNKTFWDILKWQMTKQRVKWPRHVDYGATDKPPQRVAGDKLRVSFVNHSTLLLQGDGVNILIDPVWSQRASPLSFIGPKRVNAPGIAWDDLPPIDVVLISHSHYDHLDIPTIRKLAARDHPLFIMPLGVDGIIKKHVANANCMALDWWQKHKFQNATIHAVPAQHWSSRSPFDRNKTLWCGFVVETPHGALYYAGDTGWGTGKIFRDIHALFGPLRFAMIPIGAYEPRWFMKDSHARPDESVNIFHAVQVQHALGIHWGTFQLTDEGVDEPVTALEQALDAAYLPRDKFRTLKPGQFWDVP